MTPYWPLMKPLWPLLEPLMSPNWTALSNKKTDWFFLFSPIPCCILHRFQRVFLGKTFEISILPVRNDSIVFWCTDFVYLLCDHKLLLFRIIKVLILQTFKLHRKSAFQPLIDLWMTLDDPFLNGHWTLISGTLFSGGLSLFHTSEADADASELSMPSEFVTHCVCSLRMLTSLASASLV